MTRWNVTLFLCFATYCLCHFTVLGTALTSYCAIDREHASAYFKLHSHKWPYNVIQMSFFSALLSDGGSNMMSQDSCYQVDDNVMQPTYSGDVEFQNDDSMSLQNANTGPIGKLLLYLFVKGHAREILTIGIVLYYFIGSCSFIFFRNYTRRRRFYVTSELKRETT